MPPLYRDGESATNRPARLASSVFTSVTQCPWLAREVAGGQESEPAWEASPCIVRGELQRRVLLTAAVMLLLAARAGQSARADITTALVPMYVYPAGSGLAYWNQLEQSANKVNIDAIVNPASGPGMVADPNYVAAIDVLDATKYGKAFAYISHQFRQPRISLRGSRHPGISQPLRRQELRRILYRSNEHFC